MPEIKKIRTWGCSSCAYKQDFEPTIQNMRINGFWSTDCPGCGAGMVEKKDVNDKIKVRIATEDEIDALDVTVKEKTKLKHKRLESIAKLSDKLDG